MLRPLLPLLLLPLLLRLLLFTLPLRPRQPFEAGVVIADPAAASAALSTLSAAAAVAVAAGVSACGSLNLWHRRNSGLSTKACASLSGDTVAAAACSTACSAALSTAACSATSCAAGTATATANDTAAAAVAATAPPRTSPCLGSGRRRVVTRARCVCCSSSGGLAFSLSGRCALGWRCAAGGAAVSVVW
jgi:hypothetical protein